MTPSSGRSARSGERQIVIDAPAKLNLGLEVIGRRDDGFHEIATIFLTIDLYDRLTLSPSADLELSCDDDALPGEDNLALRALQLLRDQTNHPGGARLHLRKRIPAAAGLGGASSDAAAVLLAGRELWQLDVSDTRLHDLAAQLGSDVPFFLRGGCAIGRGRGDLLEPLPLREDASRWLVVVVPDVRIPAKTANLYARLSEEDFSDGSSIAAQAARLRSGLVPDATLLGNAFARPLYAMVPELAALPDIMRDAGAASVAISGAGPAHYAVVINAAQAERVAARLRERLGDRAQVIVARPAPARP
ncbi:MAG: ispE [Thermomicrobiales bacterium]|jgi:4-diphosphocytidyl-2-C-methyl-D-erythritol kinase|nr:ispE [Thermomicrobiales bacterium]